MKNWGDVRRRRRGCGAAAAAMSGSGISRGPAPGWYELSRMAGLGIKPALESLEDPPVPLETPGKGWSCSSCWEEDGEAAAPQERRCSPRMELSITRCQEIG